MSDTRALVGVLAALCAACGSTSEPTDAGSAALIDGGVPFDVGTEDAGSVTPDAGPSDAGDLGPSDGGVLDVGGEDVGMSADAGAADGGAPAARCAPLPAPSGTVVRLSPSDVRSLAQTVRSAASGTTILLEDGTYTLRASDGRLRFHTPGVSLRGASGDATKVIIDADYVVDTLVYITVGDITVSDLTLTHAVDHLVHVTADGDATSNPTGVNLYRIRLIDGGEQFVKGNSNGADTAFPDEGSVECSYFELTDAGRPHIERNPGGCYTGGIDVHEGRDWVVRDNEFHDIYCAGEGLAEHAIHFWRGARDTLIERNVIVNCARGIGLGLLQAGAGRTYDPDPYPGVAPVGHFGGMVRGNVIYSDIPYYDTGIELQQAHKVRVLHNTVVSEASATGRYTSIDARFANTDAYIANNLARRFTNRNGATEMRVTNLSGATPSLLVDPANGDFHLSASATDAIGQGTPLSDGGEDLDGDARGSPPDIGADQR